MVMGIPTMPRITRLVVNEVDLTDYITRYDTSGNDSFIEYNIRISNYFISRLLPKISKIILELDGERVDTSNCSLSFMSNNIGTFLTVKVEQY